MLNSSFRAGIIAASLLASTAGFGAPVDQQEAFIDEARAAISECSQVHELDVSAQQQMQAVRIAQQHLKESGAANAQIATVDEAALTVPEKFPTCRTEVRQTLLRRADGFIHSFKDASREKQARQTVLQWQIALDAIATPAATRETEKFEALANQLVAGMH